VSRTVPTGKWRLRANRDSGLLLRFVQFLAALAKRLPACPVNSIAMWDLTSRPAPRVVVMVGFFG
jgi:hypothetical protein